MIYSKEQLEMMLEAVRDTRNRHREAIDANITYEKLKWRNYKGKCALCLVSTIIRRDVRVVSEYPDCECHCPWGIFTGKACIRTRDPLKTHLFTYDDSPASIIRLTDWEIKLIEMIAEAV